LDHPPDLLSLADARPVWKIWMHMGEEFHPPLYSIALRLWRDLFGSTEAATRSLSALAGMLGILCIFDVGRLAHGRVAGLWAATIFAVAGPQVEFAQDARGYTLVVLFGLCALAAMVRIEVKGVSRRRLVALGVSVLAMMLTHYVGIPVAVALGFYSLVRLRGKVRWKTAAAILTAGIIYGAIWAPFMPAQRKTAASVENDFLLVGPWSRLYAIEHLASLPIRLLGPPVEKEIASTWPACIVYFLPLLLWRKNRFLSLWLFWLLGAAGLFAMMDQINRTHQLSYPRYVLMCGPGFYLIFAGLLADAKKRWMQHVVPALVIVFCLVSLPSSYAQWRWPDWRAIAQGVDEMKKPNDLVAVASEGKRDWFSGLYMSYAFYSREKPKNALILVRPADAVLREQLRAFSGVVLINGTNRPPTSLFPGYRVVKSDPFLPFVTTFRLEREKAE
ncbi:MAG TPA: glycosyltransferase family 39 protein, partial [Tepidisphaeraceae bacterium]|nr:glycosyltransferase family 39 protein [Tepidisphaeraceae bacterium]